MNDAVGDLCVRLVFLTNVCYISPENIKGVGLLIACRRAAF